MQIKIGDLCRGDGKLFIKLTAHSLHNTSTLKLECLTNTGISLPSKIYQLGSSQDDSKEYIAVIPNMPCTEKLVFTEILENGQPESEPITRTIGYETAKWESRLNYRLKKNQMQDLRNFDIASYYSQIGFTPETIVPRPDSLTVKGFLTLPYSGSSDVEISVFSDSFKELQCPQHFLGDSEKKLGFSDPQSIRTIPFFIEIPHTSKCYLIKICDTLHPEYDNFAVIDSKRINDMVEDWEMLHLDAGSDPNYPIWFADRRAKSGDILRQSSIAFPLEPVFSIIVPLYKTPLDLFEEMIQSVLDQSYANWELILVNASPEETELAAKINNATAADSRIREVALDENMGISLNTRKGIEVASGDYVCFFDHDDVLTPDALFEYTAAINNDPQIDLLYCDEDKIMLNGKFGAPYFKPDYSIDLLRNNNYICHFLCIRKSLLDTLEPSPKDVDGAQDHDLTLKVAEKSSHIHHVPKILYHWRMCEGSTATDTSQKSYATEAGIRAVTRHLDRSGIKAKVEGDLNPFTYRVTYEIAEPLPLVSIVIPSKDNSDVLDTCIRSIVEKTTYANYEIIVIENNSEEQVTFDYYDQISNELPNVRIIKFDGSFNFSKIINFGVANSQGDYLMLLNNDTELITPNWLEELVGICSRSDVGAVGVRLWSPDDTIQHAGVGILGQAAEHLNFGYPRNRTGYFGLTEKPQNMSAVTAACMMVRRDIFNSVSGFDEGFEVAYNDVDFCLRLRDSGKLIVYWPYVELYHYESLSRGHDTSPKKKIRLHKEASKLNERWTRYYTEGDPYYNPNLYRENGMYLLNPKVPNNLL